MGHRQVQQAALFYEFSLEERRHVNNLTHLIPQFLEHLLHLVQLERPVVLPLELSKDMNLAGCDLVSLDGAFLCMEGAHVAHEISRDGEWQL